MREEDEACSRDSTADEEWRRNVGDAANTIYRRDITHYLHIYYFVYLKQKMEGHCKFGLQYTVTAAVGPSRHSLTSCPSTSLGHACPLPASADAETGTMDSCGHYTYIKLKISELL